MCSVQWVLSWPGPPLALAREGGGFWLAPAYLWLLSEGGFGDPAHLWFSPERGVLRWPGPPPALARKGGGHLVGPCLH